MRRGVSLVALLSCWAAVVSARVATVKSAAEVKKTKAEHAQHVDPPKAVNPIALDARGVPVCTAKFPQVAAVALQRFETCSMTCEKAFYFKDKGEGWHEYRKCHSCCADRRQHWEFENREKMCPFSGGKLCGGKGKCNYKTKQCECFALHGGVACDEKRHWTTCSAVGDPHWRTFDGLTHNVYHTFGESLQYFRDDDPHKEAVVLNVAPFRKVATAKGYAIRRDQDIVKINPFPEGGKRQVSIELNCKDITAAVAQGKGKYTTPSGLTVRSRGVEVRVTSPSGLELTVLTYWWGQNMFLRSLMPRDGLTRGLCGNFNGNRGDDLAFPVRNPWREPTKEVLVGELVPKDHSLLSCARDGYSNTFDGALIDVADIVSRPSVISMMAEQARAPREPITFRKSIIALTTESQRTDLEDVYQHCKGSVRTTAEDRCVHLFEKGAGAEFVPCVEDQCEMGADAEAKDLVGGALDQAGEEKLAGARLVTAREQMKEKEFEQENGAEAQEGPADAGDGNDE